MLKDRCAKIEDTRYTQERYVIYSTTVNLYYLLGRFLLKLPTHSYPFDSTTQLRKLQMCAGVSRRALSLTFGLAIFLVTSINTSHHCHALSPHLKSTFKPFQTFQHPLFRIESVSSKDAKKRAERIALMSSAPVVCICFTSKSKPSYTSKDSKSHIPFFTDLF